MLVFDFKVHKCRWLKRGKGTKNIGTFNFNNNLRIKKLAHLSSGGEVPGLNVIYKNS